MSKAQKIRWAPLFVATLIALAVSLFVVGAAHAHTQPELDVRTHNGATASDADTDEDWIPGHCHGGPSCTGALYLSPMIRPEGIDRMSRSAFSLVGKRFLDRISTRDPPVPIQLR